MTHSYGLLFIDLMTRLISCLCTFSDYHRLDDHKGGGHVFFSRKYFINQFFYLVKGTGVAN